eukprot:430628-Pleurochrysis_carterae.AAC.1
MPSLRSSLHPPERSQARFLRILTIFLLVPDPARRRSGTHSRASGPAHGPAQSRTHQDTSLSHTSHCVPAPALRAQLLGCVAKEQRLETVNAYPCTRSQSQEGHPCTRSPHTGTRVRVPVYCERVPGYERSHARARGPTAVQSHVLSRSSC